MGWKPDYATLAQLKAHVRVGDDADDAELTDALSSASRAVDSATTRQFGVLAAPATWYYTAGYNRLTGVWIVLVDDVATTTGMVVVVDGVTVTDYTLGPRQAVAKGKVWTYLTLGSTVSCSGDLDGVAITALWGWPAVPAPVKFATILQASRFAIRRDSPYGTAGSPADGTDQRLLAQLDPDVRVSLRGYERIRGPL